MQVKYNDASYGLIIPLDGNIDEQWKRVREEMEKPNVAHVEVFKGTEENIKTRSNFLGVKKRYQKATKTR